MRKVTVKKHTDKKNRTKNLTISHTKEDKECRSHIRKSFTYYVEIAKEKNPAPKTPEIHMKKTIDRKKKYEACNFQVKGEFHIVHARQLVKVRYHHTLDVQLFWKKDFSPKKSAVLTK